MGGGGLPAGRAIDTSRVLEVRVRVRVRDRVRVRVRVGTLATRCIARTTGEMPGLVRVRVRVRVRVWVR